MDIKKLNEKLEKLLEAKPMRAWEGKLDKINKLINWMADKGILTKSDIKKRDSIFHKYYRYYNDGDFPRGLKGDFSAYDYNYGKKYMPRDSEWRRGVEGKIESALETQLEDFIKYILSKYLPKVNRREFHRDMVEDAFDYVLRAIQDKSLSSVVYWLQGLPADAREQVDISELESLIQQYEEIAKEVPDKDGYGTLASKVYRYGRDTVLDEKPEAAEIISKIDKKLVDLDILVRNMKKAAMELWSIKGE